MKTIKRLLRFIFRKNINDKAFMEAVLLELNLLKKHLSKYEKEALNVDLFHEGSWSSCIYGQATGDGRSHRAKELMDECAIVSCSGRYSNRRAYKSKNAWLCVNKFNENSDWFRDLNHMSALEGYLIPLDSKSSEVRRVFDFLTQERLSIELEGVYSFHNINKKD